MLADNGFIAQYGFKLLDNLKTPYRGYGGNGYGVNVSCFIAVLPVWLHNLKYCHYVCRQDATAKTCICNNTAGSSVLNV